MINLAGKSNADEHIKDELTRARIPIVQVKPDPKHSEVPYGLIGRLGDFTFKRAWYYWVATGRMSLERAKKLYADPEGKVSVRVAGHCACPPPEDPWIRYVGESAFIESYHIDTQAGLRLFADEIHDMLKGTK